MRLFAILAGIALCLSSTSCQSYGDSNDYIPMATVSYTHLTLPTTPYV